jgi:L-threonylcarbamoyladenylate synthase
LSSSVSSEIARAVGLLRVGELVAFPTETVYGLGADARNPAALARVFAAKGRPANHPLIVHLHDIRHLNEWAQEIPESALALAKAFWPGPLTLILKRAPSVSGAVTGGQATVGLRVPDHPVAQALLAAFGSGIAAPSANRFGRISPTTAAHVRDELGSRVSMVLDGGACAVGIESTIVDLSRGLPVLLRPGRIGADQIARVCGQDPAMPGAPDSSPAPRVPGSHAAHYAPATPLRIVKTEVLRDFLDAQWQAGNRCAVLAYSQPNPAHSQHLWRTMPDEPAGYAHDLYAAMRDVDATGARMIVVEEPPGSEPWRAIVDRLRRAAVGSPETRDDRHWPLYGPGDGWAH